MKECGGPSSENGLPAFSTLDSGCREGNVGNEETQIRRDGKSFVNKVAQDVVEQRMSVGDGKAERLVERGISVGSEESQRFVQTGMSW